MTRLDASHADRVTELCHRCNAFFELTSGEKDANASARGLLEGGPPGFAQDNKYVFGIERAGELVGVVELLEGFPAVREWYVGIFLLLPEERNRGIGRAVCAAMEAHIRSRAGNVIRLVVQEQNVGAARFWTSVGFVTDGQVPQQLGKRANVCWRFQKMLSD